MSYNKHLKLYQLTETHKPDIIIGTETHLNKDIDSREIFPPNNVYSAGIAILKSHGKKFTKPKLKADILNEQYDGVFTLEDSVLLDYPITPTQTAQYPH